ncbi:MAG: SGNH/GDSL hydrolase family protein [Bdellovibrionales bacterium]|nr:SGNH/GDSL hydrolase family protein [Massilia sp.]
MRQVYEYHSVLGYRYIPNLKARIPHEGGGYLLKVNETGFRSERPFVKPRVPGSRRVLFFGDSFTAGDAVANPERYTDLLERRMPALETYNFGVSSTGTDQQYLAWREFAQDIEHDAVVIAVFVENVRRIVARYRPHRDASGRERLYAKPYFTFDGTALQLHQVPPPAEPFELDDLAPHEHGAVDTGGRFPALRGIVTALGARELVQRLTRYQPLPAYNSPNSAGWLLMRAILAEWISKQQRPVVLMPLPLPQHLDELCDARPYQARFAELAEQTGCTLHDPLPAMLAYPPALRRAFRWVRDIHYTPAGHQAIADSLVPVLERVLARHSLEEGTPCPN